jgi:hypothetical protein
MLAFNPAASVTCDTLFRLQDSDKAKFGCDKIEISALTSHFGLLFSLMVTFAEICLLKDKNSFKPGQKSEFEQS